MNITIVGAGNVGTQLAVHCASKGNRVTFFTSNYDKIEKHLAIVNNKGEIFLEADIQGATSDSDIAFTTADLVIVTLPSYMMKNFAEQLYPYANSNMKLCIVPGNGGGECAFKKCIDKGMILFGLQRVPSVARLINYGKTVRAIGYRDRLHVASIPRKYSEECAALIADIMDIPCDVLPNYLTLTMTPANPILHTTRLKTLFGDYTEGVFYNSVPLFYEEWTDETTQLLFECDAEVQKICKTLNMFDLSGAKSLKLHYENDTVSGFTAKIRSIEGFKGLKSPVIKQEKGYIPDLKSRYFVADFSYGLFIINQIGKMAGVETPKIDELINWYGQIALETQQFNFGDYGINTLEKLVEFYQR